MGWFRRKKRDGSGPRVRLGVPFDPDLYLRDLGDGTITGLPDDGRYWLMKMDTHGDETRMMWERAATFNEAKQILDNFAGHCKKRPERINRLRVTEVDGIWGCQQVDDIYAVLSIWHPSQPGVN